jgi:hypothetical protein
MRAMPLPRSLTCSSCQHTYPEGWKRCPYCGFDPEKQKRDRQIERALVKRFPSYAAAVKSSGGQGGGQKRRQGRRDRSQDRPTRSGDPNRIAAAGETTDAERKRPRRRRGRRRRGGAGQADTPAGAQDSAQGRPNGQRAPQRESRASNDAGRPTERPQGDGSTRQSGGPAGDGNAQAKRTRRRRPRRRRRPQGSGGPEKKSDS